MNRLSIFAQTLILAVSFWGIFSFPAMSKEIQTINVVSTIAPLHSIVSRIAGGVGVAQQVITKNQNAHHASLKPSQVSKIYNSDLVFWIGPEFETYLADTIGSNADKIKSIAMLGQAEITVLEFSTGEIDPHIWLSASNAQAIAQTVLEGLVQIYPASSDIFNTNLAQFNHDLLVLQSEIDHKLSGATDRKFLVAHNSLQYFAKEYGLQMYPVGSRNEELPPTARQISHARSLVGSGDFSCLIVGPHANSSAFVAMAAEASLPVVAIDASGAQITSGREHYFQLMQHIAEKLSGCK